MGIYFLAGATMQTNQVLKDIFCAVPFAIACDLHVRLKRGCDSSETRNMLHQAMRKAGLARGCV